MLVITRRINESIIIDGCIEVVVTGIAKDGIRLGISAPREKAIYRREIYDAIAEANREAAAKPAAGVASTLFGPRLAKRGPPEGTGRGGG